jgi:hypothetical protein
MLQTIQLFYGGYAMGEIPMCLKTITSYLLCLSASSFTPENSPLRPAAHSGVPSEISMSAPESQIKLLSQIQHQHSYATEQRLMLTTTDGGWERHTGYIGSIRPWFLWGGCHFSFILLWQCCQASLLSPVILAAVSAILTAAPASTAGGLWILPVN